MKPYREIRDFKKRTESLKLLFFSVFVFTLFFLPIKTWAARLYLSPSEETVYKRETFLVEVRIDTEREEINTVEVDLGFPENLLESFDIIRGGSVLTLWPKGSESNGERISFIGGVPGGFNGDGLLARISFLAKEVGGADVVFGNESKVLLNDGEGTKAPVDFSKASYQIRDKPEGLLTVISQSHPDQNSWYGNNTLQLYWDLEKETEYSWVLSYSKTEEPDDVSDRPEGDLMWMGAMEYEGLQDGIYYFHLKERSSGREWSPKTTFRAMIDSTSPKDFEPKIAKDESMFEGRYFLSFFTEDETSGVDRYEVLEIAHGNIFRVIKEEILKLLIKEETLDIESEEWEREKSPYLLKDQDIRSRIYIKAVDKAGNERIAAILPPYKMGAEDIIFLIILALIIALIFYRALRKKRVIKRKN